MPEHPSRLRVLPILSLLATLACKGGDAPPAKPGGGGAGPRAAAAFPVEVQPADARRVEYQLTAVGTVEAFEEVQVTAKVEGAVERVLFQEGDVVAAGRSLAEIEPERFRLEVAAAQAALERAEAEDAEARAGLSRRESADGANAGVFSQEDVEAWRARAQRAAASKAQARVALEQKQLDLEDSRVKAPVGGVIQTRTVRTGEYVKEGAVLATLVRRDPLLLRFEVPEADAARVKIGESLGFRVKGIDRDCSARIAHVAASASDVTRMVAVTAHVVPRDAAELRPGAFAEVRVPVGASEGAVVVPGTAVRPSERGFLVFVIADGKAQQRVVELGLRTADGGIELRSGVEPGEIVAVRGAEALRDGAAVRIIESAAPAPASSAP